MDKKGLFNEYVMVTSSEHEALTTSKEKYIREINKLKQAIFSIYSTSDCADTVRYCRRVLDGEE